MGEVKVIVDAGTNVVVSGVPIMGEFHQAKDKVAPQLGPESPIVRVKGMALMGSVSVQRLPPPGYSEEDPRHVLIPSGCAFGFACGGLGSRPSAGGTVVPSGGQGGAAPSVVAARGWLRFLRAPAL